MLPGIKLFDLTGKVAVVTGASKGLGHAIAAALASAGADLLITSRHLDEAEAAAAELRNDYGRRVVAMHADATQADDNQAMVDRAIEELGKVDILIANAGVNIRGPIEELSFDQFKQVMDTNAHGLWLACRAVVPHMKQQRYGRIIVIASSLGVVGLGDRTPYAMSKGAAVQLTRTLALELAPSGITCNAICPGPFLTPMNVSIAELEHTKKSIVGAVALERWGELHEIQGAAIYLASDASSFTTGSLLMVDGGWTAR